MVRRHVLAVKQLVMAKEDSSGLLDQVLQVFAIKFREQWMAAQGLEAVFVVKGFVDGDEHGFGVAGFGRLGQCHWCILSAYSCMRNHDLNSRRILGENRSPHGGSRGVIRE